MVGDPTVIPIAAHDFLEIGLIAGHPRTWFGRHVRDLLQDDARAIAAIRGDELPEGPGKAGTSPAERVELVRRYLMEPARQGDVVMWMDYRLAKVGWPPVVELGDHVALYDDDWLRSCVEQRVFDKLPPEVATDAHPLRMLLNPPEDPDRDVASGAKELAGEAPNAYLRVSLGNVEIGTARELAVETAEAVVGLASLYGFEPSTWEVGETWVNYIDGQAGGMTFGGHGSEVLTVQEHVALSQRVDHTADTLARVADELGPHLPVRDQRVGEACKLLSALRQARRSSDAARILLCDPSCGTGGRLGRCRGPGLLSPGPSAASMVISAHQVGNRRRWVGCAVCLF